MFGLAYSFSQLSSLQETSSAGGPGMRAMGPFGVERGNRKHTGIPSGSDVVPFWVACVIAYRQKK